MGSIKLDKVYFPGNDLVFLSVVGVANTYQLIGKYLTLKESGDVKQHQDMMYHWLKSIVSRLLVPNKVGTACFMCLMILC